MSGPIPGPYAWPVVGNMFDIRSEEGAVKALDRLATIYGPVFQLTLGGRKSIMVSSAEILKQVADEKNFIKIPPASLNDNNSRPQGLFSAHGNDPDWGQAHRILMPAFGPLSVEDMFGEMKDIASQMCLKWARMGSDVPILLTDDFTRLTLDTIALCAMDFRFNSFYRDSMHPFVDAMNGTLTYSGKRSARPWIYNTLMGGQEAAQYREDAMVLKKTAQQIINRRRENPSQRNDLLNTMIYGKDPKTGETMRDELISANMITFLIAGHETTSGLLSFTFTELLKHPRAYLHAQEEVDRVIGAGTMQTKHLKELHYLNGALREALRLHPTAPTLTKQVHPDRKHEPTTFCDGKYVVDPAMPVRVLLGKAMTDPTYFGEDANDFVPERMMDTNPNFDHYMAAWKPFGNGSRSCIGQNFAWQEAVMVLALILQNFDINLADPGYQLRVKQALTIKPRDLYVRVKLRKGMTVGSLNGRIFGADPPRDPLSNDDAPRMNAHQASTDKNRLTVLYGSNSGTCQSLAQKLASMATRSYGVDVSIDILDSAIGHIPTDCPVVIVTASYEGQPTDNAARFVTWLETFKSISLTGTKFAVFACGHKDWHETLYRIPKLIDSAFEAYGAERIFPMGTSDVSQNKVVDDFDAWQDAMLKACYGESADHDHEDITSLAEIDTDKRAEQLSNGMMMAKVKDIKLLTHPDEPHKYHMEVELPEDMTYECGDYLSVLPMNPDALVKRIMAHWELPWDATIMFHSKAFAPLPQETTLSIYDILKGYFEISQQASKKNLQVLKPYTTNANTTSEIDTLTQDDMTFTTRITTPKLSLFNFLTAHRDVTLPFPVFLSQLTPLRVRQYSISSSPLPSPRTCSITYSLHRHPDPTDPSSTYQGVASTYLSQLQPDDTLHVSLLRTPGSFRADPSTPLILVCAGTGFAPFRGLLQQRAYLRASNPNVSLAPALLFVGCRSRTRDRLYGEEVDAWIASGIVDVRYAFSREAEHSGGCGYVGERMERDADDVVKLWRGGARVYICGSRGLLESVSGATNRIFQKVLDGEVEDGNEEEKERRRREYQGAVRRRVVRDVFD